MVKLKNEDNHNVNVVVLVSQSVSLTQYVVLSVRRSACLPACLPVRLCQLAS